MAALHNKKPITILSWTAGFKKVTMQLREFIEKEELKEHIDRVGKIIFEKESM